MNEAERCDRISLMHAGRVLVSDTPAAIIAQRGAAYPGGGVHQPPGRGRRGIGGRWLPATGAGIARQVPRTSTGHRRSPGPLALRACAGCCSYTLREALELLRDPIRLTLAMLGSAILMLVLGYGITMDVENLTFAVLDRDQTTLSRDYVLNLSGSRYFTERRPHPRLRRSGTAHARRRDQAWRSRFRPASHVTSPAARRCRSAPGSTAPCPSAPKPCAATCRGCMPIGCPPAPREAHGSVSGNGPLQHRDALSLQPGREEPAGHGAGGDPAAAADDPGHPHAHSRWCGRRSWAPSSTSTSRPCTRLEFLLGKQTPYVVLAMIELRCCSR